MKIPEEQGRNKWPKHGRARAMRNAHRNRARAGHLASAGIKGREAADAFFKIAGALADYDWALAKLRKKI